MQKFNMQEPKGNGEKIRTIRREASPEREWQRIVPIRLCVTPITRAGDDPKAPADKDRCLWRRVGKVQMKKGVGVGQICDKKVTTGTKWGTHPSGKGGEK